MNTAMSTPAGGQPSRSPQPDPPHLYCPGCCVPVQPAHAYCLGCGIWLAGPQVAELRWIDGELRRVDAARTWLISRRAVLVGELSAPRGVPGGRPPRPAQRQASADAEAVQARPQSAGPLEPPPASAPEVIARERPEVSARTVARILLAAGAALVVIAVIAFTVANWARIGALGRFGILLAATGAVLAVPPTLVRRGLNATAETVGAIGLGLTIADVFLLARAFPGASGPIPAAIGAAALAALFAGYGVAVRLIGPRLAAIGLAQLSAPLAAVGLVRLAAGPAAALAGPVAVALVVDAAVCLAIVERAHRRGLRSEAIVASAAALATWSSGVLVAAGVAAMEGRSGTFWLSVTLVAAAAVAMAGPRGVLAELARPAAAASGALLAVGLAAPWLRVGSGGWGLAAVSGCAGLVGAVALAVRRLTDRRAEAEGPEAHPASAVAPATPAGRAELAAAGAAAVLAGTVVLAVPAALVALLPARRALSGWSGPAAVQTAGGFSVWPGVQPATAIVAFAALACWLAPAPALPRRCMRAAAVAAGALAVAALPAAAHLAGWAALAALTAPVMPLLAAGTMRRSRGWNEAIARVCMTSAIVLAASAALRSLSTPAETIAECAVLTVAFCAASAMARPAFCATLATAGGLAAATGLAFAAPLASGWPARYAAFAALVVAIAAVGLATWLRASRPVHSIVLDVGAAAIALLSALVTAGVHDEFALLAVFAALAASVTAWQRAGARRQLMVIAAGCAALSALVAQWRPLATALVAPGRMIARPWRGDELAAIGAGRSPGLAFAVVVLAVCAAAAITAVGAWLGSGHASLDAVALALPVVAAPVGLAGVAGLTGGLGYWLTVGTLLVLTLGLTAWAALGHRPVPAAAALVAAALTVAWGMAAPLPTLVVLACLTLAYPLAAWRARQPVIRVGAVGLAVVAAGALAECAVLAVGGAGWLAGQAALVVAAAAQVAAAVLQARGEDPRPVDGASGRVRADLAAEGAGWLMAVIGLAQSVARPQTAGLALAVVGLTCLGIASRPARRVAFWPGLALLDVASWCWLAAAGVSVIEPYTVPAAVIALSFGLRRSRRDGGPSSWLALGPGLALLLLPSLIGVWQDPGWIRPALLGLAAAGLALAGARARKQAPLVAGVIVVLIDAGRALTPAFAVIIHAVPGWIPIAVLGAALLWAGATYEARLRNLRAIRSSLAAMN